MLWVYWGIDIMIYFTSDLHLGHDREFIYKDRGYDNIREMSEDIRKFYM